MPAATPPPAASTVRTSARTWSKSRGTERPFSHSPRRRALTVTRRPDGSGVEVTRRASVSSDMSGSRRRSRTSSAVKTPRGSAAMTRL
jgi:hypothetical protein